MVDSVSGGVGIAEVGGQDQCTGADRGSDQLSGLLEQVGPTTYEGYRGPIARQRQGARPADSRCRRR